MPIGGTDPGRGSSEISDGFPQYAEIHVRTAHEYRLIKKGRRTMKLLKRTLCDWRVRPLEAAKPSVSLSGRPAASRAQ